MFLNHVCVFKLFNIHFYPLLNHWFHDRHFDSRQRRIVFASSPSSLSSPSLTTPSFCSLVFSVALRVVEVSDPFSCVLATSRSVLRCLYRCMIYSLFRQVATKQTPILFNHLASLPDVEVTTVVRCV